MNGTSHWQFGLIIAYVLPGFVALVGISPIFPSVARWLRPAGQGDLGLGAPLYAILAATAFGLVLSCFRWITLDELNRRTGVRRPVWNDAQLHDVLGGFDYLVQSHYRYYEFCGNTLIAVLGGYVLNRSLGTLSFLGFGTDLGMVVITLVLFTASHDALVKYYSRTGLLVGHVAEKATTGTSMFNGNDHGGGDASKPQPKVDSKEPAVPANPKPSDAKTTPPHG